MRCSDISSMVLRPKMQRQVRLTNNERWFLVQLYR